MTEPRSILVSTPGSYIGWQKFSALTCQLCFRKTNAKYDLVKLEIRNLKFQLNSSFKYDIYENVTLPKNFLLIVSIYIEVYFYNQTCLYYLFKYPCLPVWGENQTHYKKRGGNN